MWELGTSDQTPPPLVQELTPRADPTLGPDCPLSAPIRYLGPTDAAMSILDISMMTGFSPDIDDLNDV